MGRAGLITKYAGAVFFAAFAVSSWPFAERASVQSTEPIHSLPAPLKTPSKTIVVGFVGGVLKHYDQARNEVLLAQRLQAEFPVNVATEVFENRKHREAYEFVLRQLGQQTGEPLATAQKQAAQVIIYGHSWGASAAVTLARRLNRDGIPVLLTVQVDSIHKWLHNDSVIPPNVREAVNFFQPNGILHGRKKIRAADPARTKILGNFEMDYKERHVDCHDYPWWERHITTTHSDIECDPLVWNQIESLIKSKIANPS